jgi:hypothetical protein
VKLYQVLEEIQAKTKTLRDEIHRQRHSHKTVFYRGAIGAVGPQGPFGRLSEYSDTTLLEMILQAAKDYKELKNEFSRLNDDTTRRVEEYRKAIIDELPELAYLTDQPWDLR